MDIPPVPLAQIVEGRDGRRYEISADAGGIVARIHELDDTLSVQLNEAGGFFSVVQTVDKGNGRIVEEPVLRVAPGDWDGRVIRDLEVRAHEVRNGISAAARLDALEAAHARESDRRLEAEVGERSYDLFRAFQRDLGINPRVFIPSRQRRAQAAPVAA